MCGRYSASKAIQEFLEFPGADFFVPRYNVAPTQTAAVVTVLDDKKKSLQQMQWGIPRSSSGSQLLINIRSETYAAKFSSILWKKCLVVADGFFEWRKQGSAKLPVYFSLREKVPFVFAGLYDESPAGKRNFAILTTSPNGLVAPIHNRMPLMLEVDTGAKWLEAPMAKGDLEKLCPPVAENRMMAHDVTDKVNSPLYENPDCVRPIQRMIQSSLF